MHAVKEATALLATLIGAVAADLGTKALAEQSLMQYGTREVVGEWFRFSLAYNQGVAFGFFATDGPSVIIVSGLATLLLAAWTIHALRAGRYPLPPSWALGLLLGGAVANLLDRLGDGRVTDFIDLGLGAYRWATFNLADVFIVFGVGLLFLASYRHSPEEAPEEDHPTCVPE
jgi:signal peptidase II